uniref:Uncharacterized protein n=1 Tax=Musa acuminata subsp. malaccensis TaxID=214687 RepID=A0A804JC50_MUSAM
MRGLVRPCSAPNAVPTLARKEAAAGHGGRSSSYVTENRPTRLDKSSLSASSVINKTRMVESNPSSSSFRFPSRATGSRRLHLQGRRPSHRKLRGGRDRSPNCREASDHGRQLEDHLCCRRCQNSIGT